MKAMILAAGRGARLRPLTDQMPKPLIKVGDKPLIAYHLIKLAQFGITEVIINISYLADQITAALGDGSQYGVNIHYSYEPEVLETGGGIYKVLPLLGPEPFLVISADIWTDYSLTQLPTHLAKLAHLVLVPNPNFHPNGDFTCENNLLGLTGSEKFTFGNIGIYHPGFFAECKPGYFRLGDLLIAQIKKQQITGEVYYGEWFNIGTAEQLALLRNKMSIMRR
jgi:MurNAc alpha-1-phosphate uridylyltransferase